MRIERTCASWLLVVLAAACVRRPATVVAPPAPAPSGPPVACRVLASDSGGLMSTRAAAERAPGAGEQQFTDTVSIALAGAVDPSHAPVPRTAGERMIFAQLYEPLIRVDCMGRPYPGLAASWSVDTSARRWSFTLRSGATFWDGTPVTTRDVAASWGDSGQTGVAGQAITADGTRYAGPAPPRLAAELAADSIILVNDRTLTIVLRQASAGVPLALASPGLAVTASGSATRWPEGTGMYRVDGNSPVLGAAAAHGVITLHAPPGNHAPVLRFRVGAVSDVRDLLDRGLDIAMTADPLVLDYAATRPSLHSIPLPWSRTYVLLAPARLEQTRDSAPAADSAFRDALARDAVRVEARGAEPPYWWRNPNTCPSADSAQGALPSSGESRAGARPSEQPGVLARRIVYRRGDQVAADLADRLVALGAMGGRDATSAARLAAIIPGVGGNGTRLVAAALPAAAFDTVLHAGTEAAYVFDLPAHVLAPCAHVRALAARLPWMMRGAEHVGVDSAAAAWSDAARQGLERTLVPLIATRARLVVRRGITGIAGTTVDWDGTPRFAVMPHAPGGQP
ncbi:MAG TPA: ABC transporter substrate-binding protein [Gemmatimonadaceae bacterium]|nr:ABC transporter substrate-binding protein [Gemmatimonadaceae bacterium]